MGATTRRSSTDTGPQALPGPVGFIGAGKVGTALAALLHARGVDVVAVSGRTLAAGQRMAREAGLAPVAARERAGTLAAANLVFLTVPDDAIESLCKEIAETGGWRPGQGVVHCSGALPSLVLGPARDMGALVASFHPLQTFPTAAAALEHMPGSAFALEGDQALVAQLDRLVDLLGGTTLHLNAEEKTLYHVAAVIASNYTVTLAALASGLLARAGIAPDPNSALRYLAPLMQGTLDSLRTLGLPAALTGPLARGDTGTIARHLAALEAEAPDVAAIYRRLGLATIAIAREKGAVGETKLEEMRNMLEKEPKGNWTELELEPARWEQPDV